MVIDDEKDVVELIKFLLEKDGHTIFTAHNGREGLEAVNKSHPELILLDVMMPEMDGYSVQTALLQNSDTKDIPIIILTAKGQMKDVFALAPNVKAYMEKPFDPKALRAKIQECVKN
jgi:CheY-like chemotaxis protein